ncbi:MAG TPA: serine/threonine-protein kinase [Xanthobacteraceae bacterium]|jgi:serine/threonine-protein kinase|nr:serine/threonine-protein kinase [Xanthobacteraceae bacterium]
MSDSYSGEPTRVYAAEPARLAPGTRLNGIFEIDARIASGGMGEIYRGHAVETGDPVAIKVMRTDLADNATALALFRKEASALHYIHHEAIVRYYIFSHDPGTGRHYLAMEFVDGQPLSELLQRGPLGFEAVRVLKERLAAGLNAAHQHGIVHRDLSPDNVLIPAGDLAKAKIIDFGIARSTRAGDGTIIGSGFAGKYNYVSPEQLGLFGGDVTAKSDIYSLGLVLAQCLLGRPIDMGGTQFEVLEKRRVLPDLRAVEARFRPLLEKMLQPNPADRPESMGAVAAWPLAAQTPAAPRRSGARGRTPSPRSAQGRESAAATPQAVRSRPLTKVAVASALLLGVGSIGFYFAKDLVLPPVRTPPPPPPITSDDKQSEGGAKTEARPDQRTQRERTIEFLTAYDGGDCFFITPERLSDHPAPRDVDGLGSSVAPFDVLSYEFQRQFGSEPAIGLHQVTAEQCPAVNFLFRTRNQPGAAPRLDIVTAELKQDPAVLTGSLSGLGDRHVELLLITDDGYVLSATEGLKAGGDGMTFSIKLRKTPGPPRPQLIFAIASPKPLEALKLPPDGLRAEQVFSKALTEASQRNLTLNVSAKYFQLQKMP